MDWQSIKIGDTTESFFISIKNEYNEQFTFNLCNFKELWRETIAWQDVIGRAKSENPVMNVDGEENALKRTVLSLANHYQYISNNNEVLLKTKYYIGGVPFHFSWKLVKSNTDVFYDEITRKLLITLANVQHQRNDLIEIVKRKDMEINQYKIEGATLMRKHIATQPFLRPEFDRKFELSSGLFEFANSGKDNCDIIKNMCNYEKFIKRDADVSADTLSVNQGPSPSKISKFKKNKEENAIRKFNNKKECKITYQSSCELLNSDDNEDPVPIIDSKSNKVKTDVTEPKNDEPIDRPKRKLRSKLNL